MKTALLAGTFALVLLSAGCAAPGEPSARKTPTPEPVANLSAAQTGNRVLLTFALPQSSVGGTPLEHPPTVQIYRDFKPTSASKVLHATAPKNPTPLATIPSELVSRYTSEGQFLYSDLFEAATFTDHPNSIAVYSVRTGVSSEKLSADSNVASLRVYPAPDAISDLTGEVTPTGVVLTWTAPQQTPVGPVPPLSGYTIYRGEAQAQSTPSESGGNVKSPSSTASAPPLGAAPSPPALQTPLTKIGESSSLSYNDSHVEFGRTYIYSVRSVLNYSSASIESSDSNFLAITPKDAFPPAAPSGLIGIFAPEAGGVAAHVDLSWAVSSEADLAGYRVYRSEQDGFLGTPLDSTLLQTPAFRDMNVASGHHYYYAVAAVDRSGNVSAPSATVSVMVPAVTQPNHD